MTERNSSVKNLLIGYFEQQEELFGGDLLLERSVLKSAQEGIELFMSSDEPWRTTTNLDDFYNTIKDCQKCPLGKTRTKFVFGVGNPNAGLLFIGEAPGHDEDLQGEPFVGRAGQLLDKILQAIELDRSMVYIANILKCRPPNNREPSAGEIASCEPYLDHQIKLIKPLIILALGRIAIQTLLGTTEPLTSLRGKVYTYKGVDVMVTYHPAALLRNEHLKRPAWDDMKAIKQLYLNKKNAMVKGNS